MTSTTFNGLFIAGHGLCLERLFGLIHQEHQTGALNVTTLK